MDVFTSGNLRCVTEGKAKDCILFNWNYTYGVAATYIYIFEYLIFKPIRSVQYAQSDILCSAGYINYFSR
jgi:hypothetical protein